jgi:hypothetical protein
LFLVVHRVTREGRVAGDAMRWREVPAILATFVLVHLAWVFFRAETFTGAFEVLKRMFTFADGTLVRADLALVAVLGAVTLGIDLFTRLQPDPASILRRAPALAGAGVAAAIAAIVVFSGGTPEPFIYFQF